MKRVIVTTFFSLMASTALASPYASQPDLPPAQVVAKVLEESPSVQSAKSGIDLGRANKSKLNWGPYEFNASGLTQQRKVKSAGDGKRDEWGFSIDRPFRVPGKNFIDYEIGDKVMDEAQFAYLDAYHEAARTLLSQWFEWAKAKSEVAQWKEQADLLSKQGGVVAKREKLGDAAKLETSMAGAASAQAEASLKQAEARLQIAASTLQQSYPGLQLPETVPLTDPQPIVGTFDDWREKILSDNHELKRVQALREQARLQATRARWNQIPDPTIGVQFGSEQGGDEKYMGLKLSIPIPGTGTRGADVDAARAQASMATQEEVSTTRSLMNNVAAVYAKATAGYSSWQSAKLANDSIAQNASKMARAYELGEVGLPDLILAQKLRAESALSSNSARIDAIEARYRLLLDSHQLWLPPGEAEEHEATAAAPAPAKAEVTPVEAPKAEMKPVETPVAEPAKAAAPVAEEPKPEAQKSVEPAAEAPKTTTLPSLAPFKKQGEE